MGVMMLWTGEYGLNRNGFCWYFSPSHMRCVTRALRLLRRCNPDLPLARARRSNTSPSLVFYHYLRTYTFETVTCVMVVLATAQAWRRLRSGLSETCVRRSRSLAVRPHVRRGRSYEARRLALRNGIRYAIAFTFVYVLYTLINLGPDNTIAGVVASRAAMRITFASALAVRNLTNLLVWIVTHDDVMTVRGGAAAPRPARRRLTACERVRSAGRQVAAAASVAAPATAAPVTATATGRCRRSRRRT